MTPWTSLERPILALAPMADVTDAAFRRLIAEVEKPDVMWTEFVSADGLYYTRELEQLRDDDNPLLRDLTYGEGERPIVAQLFSATPAHMEYASALVRELGFDGVDINMGCPDRSVEKQGAGAALIKKPALARELIRAAKRGAGNLPVSVKTRIGYTKNELATWLPELLAEEPAAITLHARTRKELSLVPARFEHVREAVHLRDASGVPTRILGNGDVRDTEHARALAHETGADGIMLGRAIFGNPWLFSDHVTSRTEKLDTLVKHCSLFEELCPHKSFAVMKKHFKAYVQNFDGATSLRALLMESASASDVRLVIEGYRARCL